MTPATIVSAPNGFEALGICARMRPERPPTEHELARATPCTALLHTAARREERVPALLLDRRCTDHCVVIVVDGEARRVHEDRVST